jgi:hypothetical protein
MTSFLDWAAEHPEAFGALLVLALALFNGLVAVLKKRAPNIALALAGVIPHIPTFFEGLKRFVAARRKGPPSGPSAGAGGMPLAVLSLPFLFAACVPILGCGPMPTAQQAREGAKIYGVPSARIAGAVCEMIGAATGADIEFLCTMAEAAGSVLGNLDSEGGPTITLPLRKGDKFTIIIRADEAEAFAEYHKAPGS